MTTHPDLQVLEQLLRHSADVVCVLEAGDQLRAVGATGQRVLGYAPAELAGKPFSFLLHPADRAPVLAACHTAQQQATPVSFGGRCLTKAGQEVELAWSALRWPATELLLCMGHHVVAQQSASAWPALPPECSSATPCWSALPKRALASIMTG